MSRISVICLAALIILVPILVWKTNEIHAALDNVDGNLTAIEQHMDSIDRSIDLLDDIVDKLDKLP